MDKELIAPCGMNCGICKAYIREKNKCPGCAELDPYLKSYRRGCTVRNCETIKSNESGYCYECETFPCRRLKQLDKRYSTKYNMSMLENLGIIKEKGIEALLAREAEKWKCSECGGVISCHDGICMNCVTEKQKLRKKERKNRETNESLIAPCGMNCAVCHGFLGRKYNLKQQGIKTAVCAGCWAKGGFCTLYKLHCRRLMVGDVDYCYQCPEYPCNNLKEVDKIYSESYKTSFIENLNYLKEYGMEALLVKEDEKWKCPECGGVISCHNGICYNCGQDKLKNRKSFIGWEDK